MKSLIGSYEEGIKRSETPTQTDAAVLETAALALEEVKAYPESPEFYDALRYNQLIWTVIQGEITTEKIFPDQITANLLSLSIFVDKQTFRAMAEGSAKRLDALININRQIAMGLRSVPQSGDQPAESAPTKPSGLLGKDGTNV